MSAIIIRRLDKKDQKAQIHEITIADGAARVSISPALIDANYSPRNRDKMIDEVKKAAKRHLAWPKRQKDGKPKAARYSASKSTGNVLIIEAIGR